MTIRPRRPEDLPACVEVLALVHRADDYPQVWQADSEGWLNPPGTTAAWVAEVDGRIAGHVSLIRDLEGVRLSRLFVDPSAQRQGLARRLMAVAVAWSQEQGTDVVLEVFADSPAVTVYERLGWRYLASGQASWTGRDGSSPAVRYYAAPDARSHRPGAGTGRESALRKTISRSPSAPSRMGR